MKIRWKFFLILLLFSLMPLLVVTIVDEEISRNLLKTIRLKSNQTITGIVSRELQQSAESSASLLTTQRKSIEMTLNYMIREVLRVLENQPKASMIGQPIYLASDFDKPGAGPLDSKPSDSFYREKPNGDRIPLPVSRDHPAFLLKRGLDKIGTWTTLTQLRGLTPLFSDLYGFLSPKRVFRLSATLDSGISIYFPGHGGVPEYFKPYLTPWYTEAKNHPQLVQWKAMADPVTGRALFTGSKAILDRKGRFIGAVAIDVLLENVIKENELSSQWSDRMSSFLLVKGNHPDTGEPGLMTIAEKRFKDQVRSWTGAFQGRWIDPELSREFLRHLPPGEEGVSGVIQLPYEGVDSIWAYSFMEEKDLLFLIIVPHEVITALSKEMDRGLKHLWRSYGLVVVVVILVVVLVVSFMAFWGASVTTSMFPQVVDAWQRLGHGDFSVRLDLQFKDERDVLIDNFNEIVPRLEENIRLHQALDLAREVQQNLIPKRPPTFEGFDIAGIVRYCDETGGDYYDFIDKLDLDGRRFAVLLGDVSGHGIAAALLMATARGLIRQRVSMPGRPAEIIADVNRQLAQDTEETGQFMTFFYSEFDSSHPDVTWVTAGHNPALLYDPQSDTFTELGGRGLALGVLEEFEYQELKRPLFPGQTIVISTDGIWEARDYSGQMFGLQRLKEAIRSQPKGSARTIRAAIADALDEFTGGRGYEDDVTMVIVKVIER